MVDDSTLLLTMCAFIVGQNLLDADDYRIKRLVAMAHKMPKGQNTQEINEEQHAEWVAFCCPRQQHLPKKDV